MVNLVICEPPTMKRALAVSWANEEAGLIILWASNDVVKPLREYGRLEERDRENWWLFVDGRYDFEDVAALVLEMEKELEAIP